MLSDKIKIPISELEQSAFCRSDESLSSKTLEEEFNAGVRWQKLPIDYMRTSPENLEKNILSARKKLGDRVIILGHHYQRDEVIKFADIRGDSFKLSQYAASQKKAEYIIFCGVHFMAETADILSSKDQKVILPNLTAGCSMSDMAQTDDVLDCWDDLMGIMNVSDITPIAYMNSTADIKSLCGEHGGVICTSSNAGNIFDWAYKKRDKILFLPDQHLGRNTAAEMGIPLSKMIIWDPFKPLGGNSKEAIENSKLILWKGHCSVHARFTLEQIGNARKENPNVNVIVHPECTLDVVQSADYSGSTEYIKQMIDDAEPGTSWAIGTEISMVNRLAKENQNKNIFCLDSIVCPCSTMYRIHPAYLSWILDGLLDNHVINQIRVPDDVREYAKLSLNRMLELN
jgi:quinolinate synthase